MRLQAQHRSLIQKTRTSSSDSAAQRLRPTDTEQHICRDSYNIPVGNGEEGYTNITSAFQDNKIGSLARAVIINPLHPDLPKRPILIHPTCNKFNAAFVKHQWKEIDRLFKLYLEDTVGPLVGQSSDGDTRRRNLMMETATSNSEKYQPIPHEEGFVDTCNKRYILNFRPLWPGLCS